MGKSECLQPGKVTTLGVEKSGNLLNISGEIILSTLRSFFYYVEKSLVTLFLFDGPEELIELYIVFCILQKYFNS